MEDNQFDLAIVDPPYGIGNFVMQSHETNQKPVQWNDNPPPKKYFDELQRVSKHRIIWGANYYKNLIGGRIIWYKHRQICPNVKLLFVHYIPKLNILI